MKRILLTILILNLGLFAQAFRLSKPTLNDSDSVYLGLGSNGITQIVFQGDSLTWLATGGGLSKTTDFGETFYTYYPGNNNLPKGGISAIATLDSLIWVAGVFDSTTQNDGSLQTGGGLAFSRNYGKSWTYVPQPMDTITSSSQTYVIHYWNGDTVTFLAVATPVQNTTWDISINLENSDTVVYITSWAGGLRRSRNFGLNWQTIPLPNDNMDMLLCSDNINYTINPQDPAQNGNHNHKGFSVVAYGDTIWVGTANGVNLGIIEGEECIRWQKFNADNSNLSGNFIIAIARQLYQGDETIWVGAMGAEGSNEIRGVNKTTDSGLSWTRTLIGERVYGFTFDGPIVYVCTERGLFKSIDNGENWALYASAYDSEKDEYLFSEDVYAAGIDRREGPAYLWVGTSDGLGKTKNDGITWKTYRQYLSTNTADQPQIYAYPNPFAPNFHNITNGDGHVRIQYYIENESSVKLEIFDFSMSRVYEGDTRYITSTGNNCEIWNGRNHAGDLVANGTYFCKLTVKDDTEKSYWTKLLVVK